MSGGGGGASQARRRVAPKVRRRRQRFECIPAAAAGCVRYLSASSGCGPAWPPTTSTAAGTIGASLLSAGAGETLTVEAMRLCRRRYGGSGLISDSTSFAEVSSQAREISARVPVPTSNAKTGGGSSDPSASTGRHGGGGGGMETAAAVPADIAKASDAAAALLVLTSSPVLRRAFASRFEDSVLDIDETGDKKDVLKAVTKSSIEKEATPLGQDTVEALHFAMLSVSSWLQSSISAAAAAAASSSSSKNRIDSAIVQCIELTVRSTDLDLPLTIPLYSSLANLIAQHSSASCQPSAQIIEVANLLRIALYPNFNPPPASFFHDPCVSLIRRGLVREAIDLLDEMDCEFGIQAVDAPTGLEMLSALAEGTGLDGKSSGGEIVFGGTSSNKETNQRGTPEVEFDAVDATELVFRLRGPLLRQLDEVSTMLQDEMDRGDSSNVGLEEAAANAEFVDLLEKLSVEEDIESDDEVVAGNDSHEVIDQAEVLKMLQDDDDDGSDNDDASSIATLADVESLRDAVNTLSDNGSVGAAQHSRTASYGDDAENDDRRIPQGLHDRMAREMVYVRGGPEWDLPDLIDQLTTYNEGREVLYTKEYEEALIAGMMIEEDETDEDDDDMLK
mmetsp:Transcript_35619/g.78066  ORF Transcript_35619/g.78066 Transcript_35619/m.78066 type:complete len:619 (+) Transcript_35619:2-1858(+)